LLRLRLLCGRVCSRGRCAYAGDIAITTSGGGGREEGGQGRSFGDGDVVEVVGVIGGGRLLLGGCRRYGMRVEVGHLERALESRWMGRRLSEVEVESEVEMCLRLRLRC
jgi:hypothetical protein